MTTPPDCRRDNRSTSFVCMGSLAFLLALAASAEPQDLPAMAVANFQNGETVCYPVVLLIGTLQDENETKIDVVNRSAKKEELRRWTGIAHRGRFKTLVELQPGENRLDLSAGALKTSTTLHYRSQTNPYLVRMAYFTDKTGNTKYETPLVGDTRDFRGKFDVALKLMQCFTAEEMNRSGYGRRTFNLELDANGRVITHIVKGNRSAEEYYPNGAFVGGAAEALHRNLPPAPAVNLTIIAFSKYDPVKKVTHGHTALSMGNMALFGGSCIYTWPNTIADAQRAFMDASPIDSAKFTTDSVGRNVFWANSSTSIGACLHELGHSFGLPHVKDYNAIMFRGIDNFTRMFVFVDPPCRGKDKTTEFKDEEIGHWAPVSLAKLACSRFFALDRRDWNDRLTTDFQLNKSAESVIVSSENGLRYVGIDGSGYAQTYLPIDPNKPAPKEIVIPLKAVRGHSTSPNTALVTVDGQGNSRTLSISDILRCYVTRWQFSPITKPWTDTKAFVRVTDDELQRITATALRAKPAVTYDRTVNFLAQFPSEKQRNTVGYAVCVLQTPEARKLKIFTGSNDSLRLWLNGKLVQQVLILRTSKPDAEMAEVVLNPGRNILLAEVSQAVDRWGLVLRLEDEQGRPVRVAADGSVESVVSEEAEAWWAATKKEKAAREEKAAKKKKAAKKGKTTKKG